MLGLPFSQPKRFMKKLLATAVTLLAVMLAAPTTTFAAAPDARELAGHYYLSGGGEMGSELLLKENGDFDWVLMYGAVDQYAHGTWTLKDGKVRLTSAAQGKPDFKLFDDDDYGKTKPAEAGMWIAIVGFPHQGPLPDVEVCFESSSGKTATAVSKPNGDAIVTMPASEQWKRAGLRMNGSKEPYQWITVPPTRAKTRLAGFTVSNPETVIPSAFKTMMLTVEGRQLRAADPNGFSGSYEKAK
jgi:hypothetical protein